MNTKTICLVLGMAGMFHAAYAQKKENKQAEMSNRISLDGSLLLQGDNPAYAVNLSYARFFNRYLGVAGSIGFQHWYIDDYKPQWEVSDRTGQLYHLDGDSDELLHLTFSIGPTFRLPVFTLGRERDRILSWECSPAFALTLPNRSFTYQQEVMTDGRWLKKEVSVRNQGGQWHYWQLKNAITLQVDELLFSVGYSFSNQHPFSSVQNIRFDGKNVSASIPHYKLAHEIFLSVGYNF